MLRILFPATLLCAFPAAATAAPGDEGERNLQNWQSMFSQYPPAALAAGEQGVVGFEVKLDRDGYGTECRVIRSSGHKRLDDETCRLVLDRGVFKGVTTEDGRRTAVVTQGVVNWVLPTLPAGTALRIVDASAMPTSPGAKTAPGSEKRICKREQKTGTLAGYERICMTASEWALQRDRTQSEWGSLQGSKGSTSGN